MDAVQAFLKVAKLTNNDQFKRYTEKYSAKFANACIRSRTKTTFAGKVFGNKEIPCCSSTVWKQSLADYANAVIVRTLPKKPVGLTF